MSKELDMKRRLDMIYLSLGTYVECPFCCERALLCDPLQHRSYCPYFGAPHGKDTHRDGQSD